MIVNRKGHAPKQQPPNKTTKATISADMAKSIELTKAVKLKVDSLISAGKTNQGENIHKAYTEFLFYLETENEVISKLMIKYLDDVFGVVTSLDNAQTNFLPFVPYVLDIKNRINMIIANKRSAILDQLQCGDLIKERVPLDIQGIIAGYITKPMFVSPPL
jgi:hypothetical protein